MTLNDRQLRSVRRIRSDEGARIYATTADFWRSEVARPPAQLCLAPLFLWVRWWEDVLDFESEMQRLAVRTLAAVCWAA